MQELITKKLEELTSNGKLDEIITKEITAALQNTAREALRSYGEVGKALEEKLKKELLSNIAGLDFTQYAKTMTDLMESSLNKSIIEYGIEPAKEMINRFVGQLEKKEWKLSEVIEKFKESFVNEDDRDESGVISLVVKPSSYGSVWIGFDEKEGQNSDYNCKYRLSVDDKTNRMWYFTNDKEKITPLTESNLTGFDFFLFKLYACQCTLILDEEECDLEWSTYNN